MNDAITLSTWAVYAIAVGTPVLAFLGAVLGHLVVRRSGKNTQRRLDREEAGRNLRWAAELAVSTDHATASMGLAVLETMNSSTSSQTEDRDLIAAVTETIAGGTIEVVESADGAAPKVTEEER